jgi:hypothetical protein
VVVAELAVVTELVRRLERLARDARHLGVLCVDQLEQLRKGRTQRKAAPALVADVGDAPQLTLECRRIEVAGISEAEFGRRALGGSDLQD